MRLQDLVEVSRAVAATRSRSAKIARLAAWLRRLEPREIEAGVAILSGRLRQGRIGLGPAAVREVQAGAAEQPTLTLRAVDDTFQRIAEVSGPGANRERVRLLSELLGQATPEERDLLIRLIYGELRQGALTGLMTDALARAAEMPAGELRRALMLAGDLTAVAQTALGSGRSGLARFRLELFRPLQPMLAQPAAGVDEALERLGEAALEYKLDGARVQVHKSGEEVRVYSRRLREVTVAVPELVDAVRGLSPRRLILDGEVLALREDGRPQPFQITMRRFGRKLDVERLREDLPLTPLFFDLLHVDGDDLIDRSAADRFTALGEIAAGFVVPRVVTADPGEAAAFLDDALRQGHEGLMAKDPRAGYAAGSRGYTWLKLKPVHTLDLVVLAAEWGHGRRRGRLSNIHLGARDPASNDYVMLGKTFKGMTDKMLEWQTRRFKELQVGTEGRIVHLKPELVVEIAFSDVQESPHYPAGMALRFARVKRYRPDKQAADADTVQTVRAILEGTLAKPS